MCEKVYVYCHECKKLIAVCCNHFIAHLTANAYYAETKHSHTVGTFEYFKKAYPDIDLEDKVLITISGGVADLTTKPFGVEVEIMDFDVEGVDAEGDERCKKDKDGNWYQEMIWESTVKVP